MMLPELPEGYYFTVLGGSLLGAPTVEVDVRKRRRCLGIRFSTLEMRRRMYVEADWTAAEVAEYLADRLVVELRQATRDVEAELRGETT